MPGVAMSAMDIVKVVYTVSVREKKRELLCRFNEIVPQFLMDVSMTLLFQETPEHLYGAAATNVSHHLNKLEREEKIESVRGRERFRVKSARL
jgi:hypothetical protein